MMNSSDIRKENKRRIYNTMLDGGFYTKHKIATLTGLSVATCNTLLNDMKFSGELLVGEEKELRGVGRGSQLFQINARHEAYLLINILVRNRKRVLELNVADALGCILWEKKLIQDRFSLGELLREIKPLLIEYTGISQIVIAVPGVVDTGNVEFSDIIELEGSSLSDGIEEITGNKPAIINDMHSVAIGYQAMQKEELGVITLAGFYEQLIPGTVTIHKGKVISGANGIAGLIGFMPLGMEIEEIPKQMTKEKCFPILSKAIGAIIGFLNPDKIVLSGELVSDQLVEDLKEYCKNSVPEKYMPEFILVSDFDGYLFRGSWQIALEKKIF